MGRTIAVLFSIFGLFITVLGFNTDILIRGNPGISTAQIMLIVGGILITLMGLILLSKTVRNKIIARWRQLVGISLPTIILLLIALEGALMFIGMPTIYPTGAPPEGYYEPADWWVCDDLGCHFESTKRIAFCEQNGINGRSCNLNAQGFSDSDDFVYSEDVASAPLRILMLGDSFTFGASASVGNSFVEVLEANSGVEVWNVSMPGAGTIQHAQWLETFAPIMQPDLVIIGFYMNDFEDNLYPIDSYFWGTTSDLGRLAIRQYQRNRSGEIVRVDSPEALYYRSSGVDRPDNSMVRAMGKTRVGSLLIRFFNAMLQIQDRFSDNWIIEPTREYLLQIHDYATENDIPVLILGIPSLQDVDGTATLPIYDSSLELFEETDFQVLDSRLFIIPEHYNPPDVHWNTEGHIVIGQQLAACVEAYQSTNVVENCISAFEMPITSTE